MTRFTRRRRRAGHDFSGAAMAQSSSGHVSTTEETTTITPSVSSPWTTSGSTTTGRGATPDGDQTATNASSSGDSTGKRTKTTITNTSYPLTNMITTKKTTTDTENGKATETVTTTYTYPASDMRNTADSYRRDPHLCKRRSEMGHRVGSESGFLLKGNWTAGGLGTVPRLKRIRLKPREAEALTVEPSAGGIGCRFRRHFDEPLVAAIARRAVRCAVEAARTVRMPVQPWVGHAVKNRREKPP